MSGFKWSWGDVVVERQPDPPLDEAMAREAIRLLVGADFKWDGTAWVDARKGEPADQSEAAA